MGWEYSQQTTLSFSAFRACQGLSCKNVSIPSPAREQPHPVTHWCIYIMFWTSSSNWEKVLSMGLPTIVFGPASQLDFPSASFHSFLNRPPACKMCMQKHVKMCFMGNPTCLRKQVLKMKIWSGITFYSANKKSVIGEVVVSGKCREFGRYTGARGSTSWYNTLGVWEIIRHWQL